MGEEGKEGAPKGEGRVKWDAPKEGSPKPRNIRTQKGEGPEGVAPKGQGAPEGRSTKVGSHERWKEEEEEEDNMSRFFVFFPPRISHVFPSLWIFS